MLVAPRYLPVGCRHFELADHEPGEIEFGQGVGAASDIAECLLDDLAPVQARVALNFHGKVADAYQSLLDSRCEHGLSAAVGPHPRRGVHQRPGDPRLWW